VRTTALRRFRTKGGLAFIVLILAAVLGAAPVALAEDADAPPTVESNADAIAEVQTHADYLWTLVAACLVFLMQAGFALVETGLTRAKNAVNICMKNLMDFSVGSLSFFLIGFGLMFGVSSTGWFGFNAGSTTAASKDIALIAVNTNLAAFLWTFTTMWVFFKVVSVTAGLRVSPEEEVEGLDSHEHGNDAYAGDAFRSLAGDVGAGA
jgi:ammonia channel protein AmtB